MEQKEKIKYQRNCLLGALGAALLIVGDLCICEVPLENTKQIPSYPKIQGYA